MRGLLCVQAGQALLSDVTARACAFVIGFERAPAGASQPHRRFP